MPTSELGVSFSILKFQFLRTKPIRSQLVTDIGRFLASLFTFLSRWPIVNQLRASGRNYYYNYNKRERKKSHFSALSFITLYSAEKCSQSHMQMDIWKLVMWLETDVGSELPMTLFNVTHPGLAPVKINMF